MGALKIAVCEDLDKDAKHLLSLIEESDVETEVTRFNSGGAFLATQPAGIYDLVFLDIYMGDVTGVEAAQTLRKMDDRCGIVFTTTSEDFRSEAFDVGAAQYLIKPVNSEKIFNILRKRQHNRRRNILTVNVKGKHVEMPFDDIVYVEVKNHNCIIHTMDGKIDTGTTTTIENIQQMLPATRFMRCHKSFIVNLSFVDSIDRDFVMRNGDTVYIRRSDLSKCKKWERQLDKWRLDEAGRDDA